VVVVVTVVVTRATMVVDAVSVTVTVGVVT
jgi:hypothetical protein